MALGKIIDLVALVFAIVALGVGGFVILSLVFASALIIGIQEVTLAVAVILHLIAGLLPTRTGGRG